ncbi:hypothetical protein LTR67_006780 [Exophiala xenobiotica]
MAFLPDLFGGRQLPQVYCRAVAGASGASGDASGDAPEVGEVQFTDDVIYRGPDSTSFLRLLVLVDDLEQAQSVREELAELKVEHVSDGEVKMDEVCYLVMSPSPSPSLDCGGDAGGSMGAMKATKDAKDVKQKQRVYRLATGDEFLASGLCDNRPPPIGYDMFRIKKELGGRRYLLMRPDRFIFAACYSGEELALYGKAEAEAEVDGEGGIGRKL